MVGVYPLWEARKGLMEVGGNIVADVRSKLAKSK
jgi:hypothetical protein